MVKDVANREIGVGDEVAFVVKGYLSLATGTVVKLTPNGARIKSFSHGELNRQRNQISIITKAE